MIGALIFQQGRSASEFGNILCKNMTAALLETLAEPKFLRKGENNSNMQKHLQISNKFDLRLSKGEAHLCKSRSAANVMPSSTFAVQG